MNKKKIIISVMVSLIILCSGFILFKSTQLEEPKTSTKLEEDNSKDEITTKKELEFLKSIVGIKANEIELIDSPIGLRGEFIAPRESIVNGVDYFLRDTKNSKMEDIEIDIGEGYIYLRTTYKVNTFIKTPIEVKVKPSLDKSQNLVLKVYDFKFLDLKIADWIVNIGVESFVKDWFPEGEDIKVSYKDGSVIIDKSNFESIILNNILIDNNQLKIDMIINIEKII